jgi:hypothetical protein
MDSRPTPNRSQPRVGGLSKKRSRMCKSRARPPAATPAGARQVARSAPPHTPARTTPAQRPRRETPGPPYTSTRRTATRQTATSRTTETAAAIRRRQWRRRWRPGAVRIRACALPSPPVVVVVDYGTPPPARLTQRHTGSNISSIPHDGSLPDSARVRRSA